MIITTNLALNKKAIIMKHSIHHVKFVASKSSGEVSGIFTIPEEMKFLFVLAHGAGAGMQHPFMEKISKYLSDEEIGTLRYNFPYSEKKNKSPDPAPILMETVRSAVKTAGEYFKNAPLLAGGKSMGGRMTSTVASKEALDSIKGIVFLGFPLHAPGKPSDERAEHLYKVAVPMLFFQGTRDNLADLNLLKPVINRLEPKATLHIVDGADHSFQLPKSADKNSDEILRELAKKVKDWGGKLM
jgi:uncharacterized protein